ncbi:MAG: hypothetical protein C4288_09125 [Leptolyngbya sp. ERB_1_1]
MSDLKLESDRNPIDLAGGQITLPRVSQAKFNALFASASKVAQLSNQDYRVNTNSLNSRYR